MTEETIKEPRAKTQRAAVLNYLRDNGSITSMEAYTELGATRLSAIIYYLKKLGFNISSVTKTVETRYGKTNITEYRMES